jgi:hypothetical protein
MDINDTTTITVQDDRQVEVVVQPKKKKKCHGNRKDQRFRRKCRVRGMNPREIERLLKKQKQMTTTVNQNNFNKRKRDISTQDFRSSSVIPKSTSSISMSRQVVTKKMKKTNNDSILNKNYRLVLLILFLLYFVLCSFLDNPCI